MNKLQENKEKRFCKKKQNFVDFENIISLAKVPYTITLTNYTQKIESEFLTYKTMKDEKSKKFFAAAFKVKSDCEKKPMPTLIKENCQFSNFNIKDEFFLDEIYGIDITNCYASVLFNAGFISWQTLGYITSLSKLDRLGAIGMLASNKKVFHFDKNNKLTEYEDIISSTENYFYFAVNETFKIMDQAKEIMIENSMLSNYLFTWVDCIYFREKESIEKITNYFDSINLKYKVKNYTQFLVKRKKRNFHLSFYEDEKMKTFFIPLPENRIKKQLENIILQKTKTIK